MLLSFLERLLTTNIVLTDNNHYYLAVDQFKNGSRGFVLATVSNFVPIQEINRIYKKLKILGFEPTDIFSVKSECKDDEFVKQVRGSLENNFKDFRILFFSFF